MSLAISISDLQITRAKNMIFSNLSLDIDAGERIAITGPSGVGKSSFLMAIAGLLKPSFGQILIDGKVVTGATDKVTMMQQRPALLPWASVKENVALGLKFAGNRNFDKKQSNKIIYELLEQIGLVDRADAMPFELSGGQQQRVALARSLAPNPLVLLLDEPFSALDPITRKNLRQDVLKLTSKRNITTVLVTHDKADAKQLCQRTFCFTDNIQRATQSSIKPSKVARFKQMAKLTAIA